MHSNQSSLDTGTCISHHVLTLPVERIVAIVSHDIERLAVVVVNGKARVYEPVISTVLSVFEEEELAQRQSELSVPDLVNDIAIALALEGVGAKGSQFHNLCPAKLHLIARAQLGRVSLGSIESPRVCH